MVSKLHSELRIASQIGDGTGLKGSVGSPTESRSKNFRMNRKTYIPNAAHSSERPTMVTFANSATGLWLLVFGAIGMLAQNAGLETALAVLATTALARSIVSLR